MLRNKGVRTVVYVAGLLNEVLSLNAQESEP